MRKTTAAAILRGTGWLAEMPGDFQDKVLGSADLLHLKPGQLVYAAGDDSGGVFGIASGSVEIHLPSPENAATLAISLGQGRWFGDLAAVSRQRRRLTVVSGTASEVFRLSRAEILRIVEQDAGAWLHFAEMLARNFATALAVIDMLKRSDSTERVAALLLTLAGSTATAGPAGAAVIRNGQAELGAMAGLGRSSVNAALGDLEARGWVQRSYGATEIIDLPGLAGFVRGE